MSRILLSVCCMALIVLFALSCGEDNNDSNPEGNTLSNSSWKDQIINVIDKWKKSYELVADSEKKLGEYRKAFWEENFEHRFMLGGKVIETFYSFDDEAKYTKMVFDKFDEILMEITIDRDKYPKREPSSSVEAEVVAGYRIQFVDKEETVASNQCPYKGYYAEGTITFTLLQKILNSKEEWRIIKLTDEALSEEQIREKYKDTMEIIK